MILLVGGAKIEHTISEAKAAWTNSNFKFDVLTENAIWQYGLRDETRTL